MQVHDLRQTALMNASDEPEPVRLPTRALVVLVGPSGVGKTTWARSQFRDARVVSSDALRALVGYGPADQRAGGDALEVLELVVERRLARGLLTVIDSLALDTTRRRGYVATARRHGVPCHAVVFDTPPDECRRRNKASEHPVPSKVLSAQLRAWATVRDTIADDGFDAVHAPGPVTVVPFALLDAPAAARRQDREPMPMRFGLQISSFQWPGRPERTPDRLAAIAHAAEDVGFSSLWVMDHVVQIPQVGREWEDILESYTTLAWLAAATRRVRLGALVTAVTFRNVAHLAKIIATLDVLSGGRAMCGIGAGWFAREHEAYGWPLPPTAERFALLEDAVGVLRVMWGSGTPAFEGKVLSVPAAICYPRPAQEHVPILIGGGGERRTLRLVAEHGDACNLMGEPDVVRHKLDVLRAHCRDVGRDPAEIEVTHLSPVLVASDSDSLAAASERRGTGGQPPELVLERTLGGTVADHIGRFRALAEAGVQHAIVSLVGMEDATHIERFGDVIAAFAADDPT